MDRAITPARLVGKMLARLVGGLPAWLVGKSTVSPLPVLPVTFLLGFSGRLRACLLSIVLVGPFLCQRGQIFGHYPTEHGLVAFSRFVLLMPHVAPLVALMARKQTLADMCALAVVASDTPCLPRAQVRLPGPDPGALGNP